MTTETGNEGQAHRKPPLSRRRIACEILAGAVGGLAGLAPVFACVVVADFFQDFAGLGVVILLEPIVPLLYVFGLAVGVYLAGNIGKQTSSFLATFGYAFIGGLAAFLLVILLTGLATIWTTGVLKIVLWIVWILALLIPPIFPTLGFNLTRRYKKPPSS